MRPAVGPELKNAIRITLTATMLAGLAVSLSGCVVYHVASTAVDAGATVVDAGATVVGGAVDVATAPLGSDSDKKKSN
jgi:hypothetical protein